MYKLDRKLTTDELPTKQIVHELSSLTFVSVSSTKRVAISGIDNIVTLLNAQLLKKRKVISFRVPHGAFIIGDGCLMINHFYKLKSVAALVFVHHHQSCRGCGQRFVGWQISFTSINKHLEQLHNRANFHEIFTMQLSCLYSCRKSYYCNSKTQKNPSMVTDI